MFRTTENNLKRARVLLGSKSKYKNGKAAAECPPHLSCSFLKKQRIKSENFERDYPAFLLSLSSSIRTGLDPLSAMIECGKLFDGDSELGKQLLSFKKNIDNGYEEADAIRVFASTIRNPDVQLFRAGYLLSRKNGSSLSDCLQRLAKVTRNRQSFRRKVRAAIAMQKLSAYGISVCAILILAVQSAGNSRMLADALSNPLGQRMLFLGACLIVAGLLWMLRLSRQIL